MAVPEALVLLAAVMFIRSEALHAQVASGIRLYPYAVVAVGGILSWRFNHSRILMAFLLLAVADRTLALSYAGIWEGQPIGRFAYQAVAILLPLNLAVLAMLPERDTLSPEGIRRLTIITIQVIGVFLLKDRVSEGFIAAISGTQNPESPLFWTPLGIPALVAFVAAFVFLVARLTAKPDAINRGYFWSLIAVFLALNSDFHEFTGTFYFATTGLVLVIAVIEASYNMAYQDVLTTLPSRRALNHAMLRLGGRYAIAMVDVDHFKKFNDTYGHDVGDQVLRKVASELKHVTGGGKSYRYGGEEFAVLFPRKQTPQIVPHLERLRQRIASARFTLRGSQRPDKKPKHVVSPDNPETLSITVSIGAAQRGDHYDQPDDVVRRADEALYKAKESGRNRVKVCETELAAPTQPPARAAAAS